MKKMYFLAAFIIIMMSGIMNSNATIIIVTSSNDGTILDSGTLRWAMHKADILPGADTIYFNIPGPSPVIIALASLSPLSFDSVNVNGAGTFIDGTSQPTVNFSGMSPKIIITNPGPVPVGFIVKPANIKICGLYITGFRQSGILIMPTADGFIIGDSAKGNVINNITIVSATGILINNAGNGKIQGNKIGVDTTGTISIPTGTGISINGPNATNTIIGGSTFGLGNIISGQRYNNKNIYVLGAKRITIKGNIIGAGINGNRVDSANSLYGIYLQNGADSCIIGGALAGEGNRIAYNLDSLNLMGAGIEVDSSYSNKISHNSIYCNGQWGGIQLTHSGNGNFPAPLITSANSGGASGAAWHNSIIELFYNNTGCSPSVLACSGETFVGTCIADNSGNWTYSNSLDASFMLTATATDPLVNNTSPFAGCIPIQMTVNVASISSSGMYSIFPNPFSSSTEIIVDNNLINTGCELKIIDVYGREIRKVQLLNPTTIIEKGDLAAGIYFYNLTTNEKRIGSGKLIIQN